ncbi:hypothetical protein BGZ73_005265 [Actinomortierella ambigua]|nr:hypothetical protein BGZ73_005265 [Actinomortierella ambigua]
MSNHPENLDIKDSVGPPPGLRPSNSSDDQAVDVKVTQDISTFGIAGRIWDSSYALDLYLRAPVTEYTFDPPCPIPTSCFLSSSSSTTADNATATTTPPPAITILEIGAGTGYVGIALAKRLCPGSTLILTDLEEVVPLMTKNAQDNIQDPSSCCRVLVEPLAWGNDEHAKKLLAEHGGAPDFIVASDLVYFPELYPPLLQTLRDICSLKTKVLFGYKERSLWKETPFWEEFGRYFAMEVVRITKHKKKQGGSEQQQQQQQQDDSNNDSDEESEEDVKVFGLDADMYVFVATKREDKDILKGVDDTLTSLMMMQIGI